MCCAQFIVRKRALDGNLANYVCCQGYFPSETWRSRVPDKEDLRPSRTVYLEIDLYACGLFRLALCRDRSVLSCLQTFNRMIRIFVFSVWQFHLFQGYVWCHQKHCCCHPSGLWCSASIVSWFLLRLFNTCALCWGLLGTACCHQTPAPCASISVMHIPICSAHQRDRMLDGFIFGRSLPVAASFDSNATCRCTIIFFSFFFSTQFFFFHFFFNAIFFFFIFFSTQTFASPSSPPPPPPHLGDLSRLHTGTL